MKVAIIILCFFSIYQSLKSINALALAELPKNVMYEMLEIATFVLILFFISKV